MTAPLPPCTMKLTAVALFASMAARGAPLSEDICEDDVQRRIIDAARPRLAATTLLSAVLYVLTAVSHVLVLPPDALPVMVSLALAVAASLVIVSRLLGRHHTISRPWLEAACAVVYLCVISHSLARLAYAHGPMDMMFVSALVVALGLIPSSMRLHTAMIAAYSAGWCAMILFQEGATSLSAFVAPLAISNALSLAIRRIESYTADRFHRLRAHDAIQHARLELQSARLHTTIERLEQAQEQLVQKERLAAIGCLAAGVAHEVNNPATYVLANLGELNASATPFRQSERRMIAESIQGVEQIVSIVRELRLFARQEQDPYRQVDVSSLIDSTLRIVAGQIRHVASVHCDVRVAAVTFGDPGQLSQVLLNLVLNAAQAMSSRPLEENRIDIIARERGETIVLQVKDNGPGLSEGISEHIFEPFFTTKPRGVGTGLGLSIAHDIVTQHQGKMTVVSDDGQGTCFTIELPAQGRNEPSSPPASAFEAAPESTEAADGPTGRVLLVDDNALVLQVHAKMLGSRFDVVAVGSPRAALERVVEGDRFDAVVSDLMMPDIDGLSLRDQLLDEAPHLRGHFVFVSGGVADSDMRERLMQDELSFLTKPFSKRQLLQAATVAIAGAAPSGRLPPRRPHVHQSSPPAG